MLIAVLSIPFRVADIHIPAYVGIPFWVLAAIGVHRVIEAQGSD